jgi:hypothetical protein
LFAGAIILSALFNPNAVRVFRHVERTATITDPAEATQQFTSGARAACKNILYTRVTMGSSFFFFVRRQGRPEFLGTRKS